MHGHIHLDPHHTHADFIQTVENIPNDRLTSSGWSPVRKIVHFCGVLVGGSAVVLLCAALHLLLMMIYARLSAKTCCAYRVQYHHGWLCASSWSSVRLCLPGACARHSHAQ